MNANFDFNLLFQQLINQQLKKDEKINGLVELANKYGIFGTDVINFLADLMTALQQFKKDENNGVIEFAKILQIYCKERDCTECAFAKSNGDCRIFCLPEDWKIPNE